MKKQKFPVGLLVIGIVVVFIVAIGGGFAVRTANTSTSTVN